EGGARELALAAVLRAAANAPQGRAPEGEAPSQPAPRDPQVDAWLRTAAAKAGDDPIAHQLLVAATAAGTDQRREAARRWQAADPGNLMPLLYADLTADALLAAARDATRADARMYEGVRWITSAYRRHPPTAAEQAALGGGEAFDAGEAGAVS